MSHYVTLGFNDFEVSTRFYDAVLETIGFLPMVTYEGHARAYSLSGKNEGFVIWLGRPFNKEKASFGNGSMVGLNTDKRTKVDAFHAAALNHGGTSEGLPGLRELYSPTWYGAYVRDPIGNKLSVFFDG